MTLVDGPSSGFSQAMVDEFPSERLGAGCFFGEAALTAMDGHIADVVSLGATGGVRCDPQGSPLGRRRPDPTVLFRLSRADFDAVVERFPALGERLHDVGMARVRRACSPQCSPIRALRRCNFTSRGGAGAPNPSAAAAPSSPNGSPRHSTARFSFLLRESLTAASTGTEGSAGGGEPSTPGGACTSPVPGRRLSDVLIDEEDDDDDGHFSENWAPSCSGSPLATPGAGRRRMSDILIDDNDSDEELAAEATLKWGEDSSD